MWEPHAYAHVVNIFWFWDRDHFFLTSARVHLLSQGHIRHIVLFLALLYGFSWHCQRCLSDPKPAAWQNTLPSTTCSLNTPIPRTPPSKITITAQRWQMMSQLSRGCSVLLSPQQAGRRVTKHFSGGSSTQLLLSDSSKGNKAPFNLVSPALPRTFAVHPHKAFCHFPSSLQHGKIRAEPIQRETGGWLSEHSEGITHEMGSGDSGRGGEFELTNWETLPGTAPRSTTTGTRKSLLPPLIITSTVPHKHTPTNTRTLT